MNLYDLEIKLKYIFKNKNLLIQALSHKSFSKLKNNEKLEFLGDSILNFIITKEIYDKFPDFNEGNMTKIRSFLTQSKILVKISKKLCINKYIITKNLLKDKSYELSNSIIENSFESIIGAIFLDSDLNEVKKFIINQYFKYFDLILKYSLKVIKDSKTDLQEISQKIFFSYPVYVLNKIEISKNNRKIFFISCKIINNNFFLIKNGIGYNKKNAEKLSAKKMISFIKTKKII